MPTETFHFDIAEHLKTDEDILFSIMISCLNKIDSVMTNDINKTVLLRYSTGPNTRAKKF